MPRRPRLSASLLLVALGVVGSCRDAAPPRPVTEFQPLPPEVTRPLPPAEPDPAEPGITELARLARYVFREMRFAEPACPFVNPLHDTLAFAFHVQVVGPHMSQVHLAWAGVGAGEELRRLEKAPAELTAYVECLAPRLEAVRMDPAPADGQYQPEYSYPGQPPAP